MSELPSNWVRTTVGNLFVTVGGGTPATGVNEYWQGTIPWISSADIDENHRITVGKNITKGAIENSATNLVPQGSVVVVTRVGLGKVAIAEVPLCFSQDHQALLTNEENFDTQYVLYYMSTAVRSFRHISRGTTISGVTKKQLLETEFVLPPRQEQTRIVAEIEKQFTRLDAATAALKRVQANLKRYRASVLKSACEGRLVPTEAELARKEGRDYEPASELLKRILRERRARWEADTLAKMIASGKPPNDDRWKEQYKEPAAPDTRNLPNLPEGWCWASLDQLFLVERGRFSIRPRNDPRFYNGPYPFVQIGDLPREGGTILKFSQSLNERGLSISRMFIAGTVLIAIVGATIGNTGVLSFDVCCPDSLVALQGRDLITLRYAEYFLRRNKLEIRNASYASGGQPNINLAFLTPLSIPIPPQTEMRRIVEKLDSILSAIESTESQVEHQLAHANALRRSVLSSAFSGQLVPQDPTDEPASVLLERIRAGRAHTSNSTVARKIGRRRATGKRGDR